MIKKILKFAAAGLLLLLSLILIRTLLYKSRQHPQHVLPPVAISELAVQHLSEAVQIPTISRDTGHFDSVPFFRMISFLAHTYPQVEAHLHKKLINGLSLLYTWEGSNNTLQPVILIGHMDVVPVGTEPGEEWENPPFSGAIRNGIVWGRGTLDDKVNVIGILEAVEMLLKQNFKPERTIYLAFGHDEEIGGAHGAEQIARYLEEQHVKASFLLDEGLVITSGIVPGIHNKNVALIGIAEKGYMSAELTVEAPGGHSSMPAKETPIGILSTAVSRLEKHQPEAQFSEPVKQFLDYIGPEMPFSSRLAFANRWLLKGIILKKYEASNAGNAIVRTTTAPTLFKSGTKDNVLPGYASATVNFRIIPGESLESVLEHVRKTINDERVKVRMTGHFSEPSPVSKTDCKAFECVEKSIGQIFPNTLIAPSLVIAGTDARHYTAVSENQYRFVPLIAGSGDLKRIHGANEKISVENFADCIRFYRQLILNVESNTH